MPVACLLRPGTRLSEALVAPYRNGLGDRLIYPCHISRRHGVIRMRP